MNIKPARGMQLLASHKIPPRSFIQIVAALAVGIVVKLYGMCERHFEKIDKAFEHVALHRAVHEEHRVVVVIQAESIAFHDLNIAVSFRPAVSDRCYLGIYLNAR